GCGARESKTEVVAPGGLQKEPEIGARQCIEVVDPWRADDGAARVLAFHQVVDDVLALSLDDVIDARRYRPRKHGCVRPAKGDWAAVAALLEEPQHLQAIVKKWTGCVHAHKVELLFAPDPLTTLRKPIDEAHRVPMLLENRR